MHGKNRKNMKNKTLIVLLSLIVLFAAFAPKADAAATFSIPDIFGWIADNTVGNFVRGLIFFINGVFTALSAWIMGIGQGALSWVISSDFIGMSMTGTDNPIINYGWPIIRDIANIFLVLSLVVIGLGMIMGIEEYQAKRTLPRLIGIAILINFTPVICGLIVDFTNLLMNYLLRGGSLDPGMANSITAGIQAINQNNPYDALARLIIYFVFSIAFSIICFVYFLLFLFRYIFIWVLVIFSPLAFVSRVFPTGWARDFFPSFFYWDEWWKQFIHWSVIGIYAAFFLSLANNMTILIGSGEFRMSAPSGILGIFQQLFLYMFPMALMIVGLNSIMEETSGAVAGAKKTITPHIPPGLKTAASVTAGTVGGIVGAAIVGAQKGGGLTGAVQGVVTAEGREKGRKWYRQGLERVGISKIGSYEKGVKGEMAERKKELSGMSEESLNKIVSAPFEEISEEQQREAAAALDILIEQGKVKNEHLSKIERYKDLYGLNTKALYNSRPDWAGNKMGEVISKQAPAKFVENVHAEALNVDTFAEMSLKQLEVMGEKGSRDKVEAMRKIKSDLAALNTKRQALRDEVLMTPTGSPENRRAQDKLDKFNGLVVALTKDANFQ
jgi:hypothetical protein